MQFEDIWPLTNSTGSVASFSEAECRALFDAVSQLPPHSHLVEVGCEYGRSTSVLAQVAKEKQHMLTLIDPFLTYRERVPGPIEATMGMLHQVDIPFTLHHMTSERAFEMQGVLPKMIDLLHIDGDHTAAGVLLDCKMWFKCVVGWGFVCFHDYGRPTLADIKTTVDQQMDTGRWKVVGTFDTLHIVRKRGAGVK